MLSWGSTFRARGGLRASPNTPGKLSGPGSLALALEPRNTSATPASPGPSQTSLLGLSFPSGGVHPCMGELDSTTACTGIVPIQWGRWWEAGWPHATQTPAWAERLERPTVHSTHAGWLVGSKRARGAPSGYWKGRSSLHWEDTGAETAGCQVLPGLG